MKKNRFAVESHWVQALGQSHGLSTKIHARVDGWVTCDWIHFPPG